ncbi:MAG: beta 1,4 glucosyltransferase [Paenibacillaceae bacterium]|jgi:glycosyltransferase involved in cell wall biosynthesis|nr:beta 1,4 glucosyltransferase [Paenibacillaceae bacterium]
MITISLCMIVKNEEDGLAECLSSVAGIADEIVIVDTGSTDRTKEIAAQFGSRIYDFEWIDDFAAARNYSFSLATKKYILWLDADDRIQEKDRQLFIKLKKRLSPDVDSVTMHYYLVFDSAGNVASSLRRNRLVRRDRGFQWIGPVHEYLAVWGNIQDSDVGITHGKNKVYTDRNLQIYLKRERAGEQFSPRDQFYFANELRDNAQYRKAVLYYEVFLKGNQGWVEDNIQACMKMGDCYERLGEREKQIESVARTLTYDKPRAEFCCIMGGYFLGKAQYDPAIFWFKAAVDCGRDKGGMGLVNSAHSTWLPHLQLCLCYDRMGQFELANEHNELALGHYPKHPSMMYNREYFQKKFGTWSEP